jgi:hypothetical protein
VNQVVVNPLTNEFYGIDLNSPGVGIYAGPAALLPRLLLEVATHPSAQI